MDTNFGDIEEVTCWVQNTISCNGVECSFADISADQQNELINLLMKHDEEDSWANELLSEPQIESLKRGDLNPDSLPDLFEEIRDKYYCTAEQLYDDVVYRWGINDDYN